MPYLYIHDFAPLFVTDVNSLCKVEALLPAPIEYLDDQPYDPSSHLTSPVEEVNAQSEPANSDAGPDAA